MVVVQLKILIQFMFKKYLDFTQDIIIKLPSTNTTFTNNSTGNIVDYIWNFGDSTISNQINPSFILNSGSYDVSLIVIDNFTCVDTVKYSVLFLYMDHLEVLLLLQIKYVIMTQ